MPDTPLRHVLFMICDDLRPMLGCYGDPHVKTPHLDTLAARGVCFDHAYTPGPLCSPARASLLTGMRLDQHGVTRLGMPLRGKCPDLVTWPQALRQQGWHCHGAGKVFHKGVPDGICQPSVGGCGDADSWDDYLSPGGMELSSNGIMRNATPRETHVVGIGGAVAWLRAEGPDHKQHDTRVCDHIVESIRTADTADKHVWAAGFARPHVPLVAPERYFAYYDSCMPTIPRQHPEATPVPEALDKLWCNHFNVNEADHRNAIRAYYACISYIDDQVGQLLQALEDKGIIDDTLIIFTSDHGYQLGEHGLWFKNVLYQESVQVPLIIADPRRKKMHGNHCQTAVDHCDIQPSIFSALGTAKQSGDLSGLDLRPCLADTDCQWQRSVLSQHIDWGKTKAMSLRDDRWTYIQWQHEDHSSTEQLFDRQTDPAEQHDLLHAQPDRHREVIQKLQQSHQQTTRAAG